MAIIRTKINFSLQEEEDIEVLIYSVNEEGTLRYYARKKDKATGAYNTFEVTVPLEDMHVSIQKGGNSKTGPEWLLNTLPGEHEIEVKGRKITNMKGSCQGCCDGCERFCYAINNTRQHHNSVMPSVIKNLLIYRLDPDRFWAEIDAEICKWKEGTVEKKTSHGVVVKKAEKVFRWHASGEVEDYTYFLGMMKIAEKHPEVHFYSYTKRFKFVEKYLDDNGDFPKNFVWNLSVWTDNLEKAGFNMEYLSKVQLFEWVDEIDPKYYNTHLHCPGVIYKGGKKGKLNHKTNCYSCSLCWGGKCKGRYIKVMNH